jgi:hypothetical protein
MGTVVPENALPTGIDRTAFRIVDAGEHFATHETAWREYWLSQPVAARLAAAMRCRLRVDGILPGLDRTCLRVIGLDDLD